MRLTPYTKIGIKRKKCFRCGKPASFQWQICSDHNQYRPICADCDIELNAMVLQWIGFAGWEETLEAYKNKVMQDRER